MMNFANLHNIVDFVSVVPTRGEFLQGGIRHFTLGMEGSRLEFPYEEIRHLTLGIEGSQ